MTDTNDANTLNTSQPDTTLLTSKQFLSFETIAMGIFALFVVLCGYVWNAQAEEFKELKTDVKSISLVIPTLVTKNELDAMELKINERMDEKFDAVDRRFEKMDDKLDTLITSVNAIQTTLAAQVTVNSYRLDQLEKHLPIALPATPSTIPSSIPSTTRAKTTIR